jgi:NhaP-type Na+/H+ or K+/H+ antiporter
MVAARVAVPAILLLLLTGVLLGQDVLGVLDVSAFGGALPDLVALGVTVILFEGGLALDFKRLRSQQRTLMLLLFVGGAISAIAGTLAAHWIAGLPWIESLAHEVGANVDDAFEWARSELV